MATVKDATAAAVVVAREANFESIEVVQPPVPSLRIKLIGSDAPAIITEGMPGVAAMELDWSKVIPAIPDLLRTIFGGGGNGGGGGNKCTTITITQKDGTTDTVTHCDPA